jgi:hypothetical protein
MNETVIVAVITAVAALSGAGMTAFINLRATRLQSELHLAIAREERAEQRLAALRTSRRDAYVRFLDGAAAAIAEISALHSAQLDAEEFERRFSAAWAGVGGTAALINVVAVEGPLEVLEAARELRAILYDEMRTLRAVREGRKPSSAAVDASERRMQAVRRMSSAARAALGADVDTR